MGNAVVRHGIHYGIAEYHLTVVWGCRVVVEHSLRIGIEQPLYLRQRVDKLQGQLSSLIKNLLFRRYRIAVLAELKSVGNLLCEQLQQLFHVYAYIIGAYCFVALTFVEVVGKDDALYQTDNLLNLLYRRKRSLRLRHRFHLEFG